MMRLLGRAALLLAALAALSGEALASGGAGHPSEAQLLQLRIIQFLGFGILFAILALYVFPFLGGLLRKRSDGIREAFEKAAGDKQRAVDEREEAQRELKKLEAGREGVLDAAARDGAELRNKLIEEAGAAVDRLRRKAHLESEIERAKTLIEVQNELSHLAFEVARDVLTRHVDRQMQDALVERFLADLDQAGG